MKSTPDTGAVERFGFAFHSIRFPNLAVGTIEKNEAGEYVRYTDYERVVAERDSLRSDAERYRALRAEPEVVIEWPREIRYTTGDGMTLFVRMFGATDMDAAIDQALRDAAK